MSTQPEALRLADALEQMPGYDWDKNYCEAVAELRRLHAENKVLHERHHDGNVILTQMLAQRDALLEALLMVKEAATEMRGDDFNLKPKQWAKVHAAIKAVEGTK